MLGFRAWTQDISQAFLQLAEDNLLEICLQPGKEFELLPGQVLKLMRPLHGLADSGYR